MTPEAPSNQMTPDPLEQIEAVLKGFDSLELLKERVERRGDRIYIPIRPRQTPPSTFAFLHAVSSAEVELRDAGFNVELVPDYPQPLVVIATVEGRKQYIYDSEDGREYDDLSTLLGLGPKWSGGTVGIEGYPYDGPADHERALAEATAEYPTAVKLSA